ncbi:hypothetical protein GRX01_12930 [Halobaculum sp. WSA2]|uniref:Uncharacterized protein n=1 Tax=Halobaculum saliterrae TaxID=2073113 RepID=A0A6B0T6W2_9EURY|nr:hypothetical protein [Halobaculum saliterrae]MXR42239.1 hypothetical protein [Halobaculum saliterrae]
MEFTASLVRMGSLLSVLTAAAAVAFLLATGGAVRDVPTVGLLATAGLLVVATLAAVAWGRGTARARWETPYW